MAEPRVITSVTGSTHVQLFPAQIAEVVRGPNGPGFRHTIIMAEKVKAEAIRIAPKKTGNLAAHIVKRIVEGPAVLVGVENVPYARFVHEGTPPHEIRPKKPGGVLVFFWPKVGETVFLRKVNHPGTKPNPFLNRALEAAFK